jgi:hypothetical protein
MRVSEVEGEQEKIEVDKAEKGESFDAVQASEQPGGLENHFAKDREDQSESEVIQRISIEEN